MSPRENKQRATSPRVIGRTGGRSGSAILERSPKAKVGDVISAFFESISGPHPEVPKTISGSLRFDLENDNRIEHWRVTFAKGRCRLLVRMPLPTA